MNPTHKNDYWFLPEHPKPHVDFTPSNDDERGLSRLIITVIYVILMGAMMFVAWHLGNANGYRRGLVMGQLCNAQPEISACVGVR